MAFGWPVTRSSTAPQKHAPLYEPVIMSLPCLTLAILLRAVVSGAPVWRPWIMMRSATDLSKADLHVFSKLFDDGLERGQEAKAFSWRQIGGHDDVLDFLVGHLINVEMTRQPAP